MALAKALFLAQVAHRRLRPKRNSFRYKLFYLCFPLRLIEQIRLVCLSLDRFNLFSFMRKDYGKPGTEPEAWIRQVLEEWGVTEADGDVVLLTLPRLMGYAFNPVSFWFCLDRQGGLRAVLSEVTNTFRDRHSYLSFHDDRRPIGKDDWLEAQKIFYVSPFIAIEGRYRFRFAYGQDNIGVWINHHDAEGLLLETSLTGKRAELTDKALLACFLRFPLVTFKVIGLIHYQAVKLVLKGVRFFSHPRPPLTEISR